MELIAAYLIAHGCMTWNHPRTGETRIYLNRFPGIFWRSKQLSTKAGVFLHIPGMVRRDLTTEDTG